jgi:drug/metabolite transporter (DMT)-like permease
VPPGHGYASTPLFAALVALAMLPDERLARRRGLGLVLGFCGVFVVLGAWDALAGSDVTGTLMALGGGIAVLGERLTWNQPVGAAVIVAGAALAQTRASSSARTARRSARRPGTPEAAPAAGPGRTAARSG